MKKRNDKLRSRAKKINKEEEDNKIQRIVPSNCEAIKEYGIDLNDDVILIQKNWKNYLNKKNREKNKDIISKCQIPNNNSYITKSIILKEDEPILINKDNSNLNNGNNINYITKVTKKDELPYIIYLQNKIKSSQNRNFVLNINKKQDENDEKQKENDIKVIVENYKKLGKLQFNGVDDYENYLPENCVFNELQTLIINNKKKIK